MGFVAVVLRVLLVALEVVVAVVRVEQTPKSEVVACSAIPGGIPAFGMYLVYLYCFLSFLQTTSTAMAHGDDLDDDFVPDGLVALSDDGGDARYDSQSVSGDEFTADIASTSALPSITPEAAKAAKKRKRRQKEKESKAKVS